MAKILGTSVKYVLYGGDEDDLLFGHAGTNSLYGRGGNDFMMGGTSYDRMSGGVGNDTLYGGGGDDILFGDGGDDFLSGDRGNDILWGGNGRDTFQFNVSAAMLPEIGVDIVKDFKVGVDKLSIKNGLEANVTFVDVGDDVQVYYNGVNIALLSGLADIPADTHLLFA